MITIFLQYLKERRMSLAIYSGAGILMSWMYISIFPSISQNTKGLEQILQSLPEGLLKAFGISESSYNTLGGFLSVEHFSMVWPIIIIILLISCGAAALSGEVEKGTVELLLSQPISRLKLYWGRYLAMVFSLAAFIALTILSIIPIAKAYGISYEAKGIFMMAVIGSLFGLAVLSLSFLFSAWLSEKGKVYSYMGGGLIVMYVLNILSSLKSSLEDLKYASFFYYFNSSDALKLGTVDHLAYWVFIGTAVVAAILGAAVFARRDIAA